jgi:NAD-dependent DNA ligase
VTHPADLYTLQERQEQLLRENEDKDEPTVTSPLPPLLSQMDGWGETSIKNLYQAIEDSRDISADRLFNTPLPFNTSHLLLSLFSLVFGGL